MNKVIKDFLINKIHNIELGKLLDLSQEILEQQDFLHLENLFEKSSFIEKLVLPSHISSTESWVRLLEKVTTSNTTLLEITGELDILTSCKKVLSRLTRNANCIFGIHGGGNIGLGLLADIVSKSEFKYNTIATSNDLFLKNLINSSNQCWLQHNDTHTCIDKIKIISREPEDIIYLYTHANIAAICLTQEAFLLTVKDIAAGLLARYYLDEAELKILILMNIPQNHLYVHKKIQEAIFKMTNDTAITDAVMKKTKLIPAVVDRIVNKINKRQVTHQIKKQLLEIISASPEKLSESILELKELRFSLFNVEKKFDLYVQDNFPELEHFSFIKKVDDLEVMSSLKIFMVNAPHAILAWMGKICGCETIAEAIHHPFLRRFIISLISCEVIPILMAKYPFLKETVLIAYLNRFIRRCEESKNDSVDRVGRDPRRKLQRNGIIRSLIAIHTKLNLNFNIDKLIHGIAAGIFYTVKFTNQIDTYGQHFFMNLSYKEILKSLFQFNDKRDIYLSQVIQAIEAMPDLLKNTSPAKHKVNSEYKEVTL